MTRILTIVALLFAMPAFGENRACNFSLVEEKAKKMKDQLQASLQQKVTTDELFTLRWTVI